MFSILRDFSIPLPISHESFSPPPSDSPQHLGPHTSAPQVAIMLSQVADSDVNV